MLFARFARKVIQTGRLTIIDAHGRRHVAGGPGGPVATLRLHDKALHYRLALNPYLYLGEAYMDGTLTIEQGSLYDFLNICAINMDRAFEQPLKRVLSAAAKVLRHLHQHNPARLARAHVAHHYDLSDRLYDLFLDADRQYSCGYFSHRHHDLERAQRDKKRHLAAKLRLAPGQRVLDIGSGWGGLALYLAEVGGGEVLGITLSQEQLRTSRLRAERAGMADRVRFELCDYREQTGSFERIVSVGMFEHVGVKHYGEFFAKIRELLTEDGVAVLHSIGRMDGPGDTNDWVRKYIFPGGYAPALSEVCPWPSACSSGSPTSRCCGCTTPKPCAAGASASWRTGPRSPGCTTSVFAGCGSSIWSARSSRFGAWATWCFRCSSPNDRTRCR